MLNLLSTSRYSPIGLDIGAESVRMLQLDRSGKTLSVLAAAQWRFPPNAVAGESDPRERRRLAGRATREMVKKGGFRGRNAISCIKTNELVVKNIRLPHMPDHELASAVMWEGQERFGFQVAPDRMHYIKAGEVRQGSESRDEIILMGVPEEAVQQHLELLEEMRLKPVDIDAEPTALFRTFHRFLRRAEDESAVTVIVDVGLAATKVVVARGKTIILIKSIDIAGQAFNESVAKQLGLSYGEAQRLRRRGGEGESEGSSGSGPAVGEQLRWSIFDAIRGQVEALAREISLCLRYCLVTFRGLRPARITLTGGEAYDPALVKLLGECLDCECEVGQPLRGVDLGNADLGSDRRGALTEWSVALGLALRGAEAKRRLRKMDHEGSRVPA